LDLDLALSLPDEKEVLAIIIMSAPDSAGEVESNHEEPRPGGGAEPGPPAAAGESPATSETQRHLAGEGEGRPGAPEAADGGGGDVDGTAAGASLGGDDSAAAGASLGTATSEEGPPSPDQQGPQEAMAAAAAAAAPFPVHWTKLGVPTLQAQPPQHGEAADGGAAEGASAAAAAAVRRPQDVVDIDPGDLELVVVGTAGQKITAMGEGLDGLVHPRLESLVLRSHLLRSIEGIGRLGSLELLELYDNQVASLDGLALVPEPAGPGDGGAEAGAAGGGSAGPPPAPGPRLKLRVLDMSYNVIRDMSPVQLCPNLQELCAFFPFCLAFGLEWAGGTCALRRLVSFLTRPRRRALPFPSPPADLANNKLKALSGLSGLSKLRKLDLGANRIRAMDPGELGGLADLEELWLGKNKIEAIGGLDNLKKLRKLDVQSNRLTRVENLQSQRDTLEELYLAHNGIDAEGCRCPTGLAQSFPSLTVLDLCRNRIDTARPFSHLLALEELWLSGNSVASFDEVRPLRQLPSLETVYLEHNPVHATEPLYRKVLASILPTLKQIDANLVGPHEASAAGAPAAPPPSATSLSSLQAATPAQLQDAIVQRALAEAGEARASQQPPQPRQTPP
jgi:protein phosphatase 1 regulatory subunit 7